MSTANPDHRLADDIRSFSRFAPAIRSAILTLCNAILLPLLLAIVAWQLRPAWELMTLKGSVHHAAIVIVPMLFMSMLLLHAFRAHGLAERHFGWSSFLCQGMYTGMTCVVWLVLPLKFFCEALETFENGAWYDSLGRMFFVAMLTAMSVSIWLACRGINQWRDTVLETRGLRRTRAQRRQHRESLLNGGPIDVDMLGTHSLKATLRRFALNIVSLLPMVLVGLSIAGYHFTAMQMTRRAIWTFLLAGMIALVTGLIGRMLLVTQFRVKLRQLKRNETGHIGENETINITDISSQVNQLLRATAIVAVVVTGWHIWSEVSPTIRFLDSVGLWGKGPESEILATTTTATHLLMALGTIGITWVLSRNLPGLLELTLIDRLPFDKGGRYAISFVVRYLVGLLGILLACNILGFSWNSVQWLAGALALGLGFGLQEIFANLISGIIILIERPVRVGDFVTINGTTGHVAQMQLRATTIRDLDMRELIIPNKKFITDDVMNWTLSDQMARMILKIGVAYESDTKLVQDTLLSVAQQHPLVLRTPAPEVVFGSFGDSTLDFELRVIVPRRDLFPKVQHQLNMAINEAFREKSIEVAFPQREIRVKQEAASASLIERKAG
jgi:potassium efflux system protein